MLSEGQPLKSRQEATDVEASEAVEGGGTPAWVRIRSGALLALLLTGIGIGVAAVIGAAALALVALLDQALG